MKRVLWQHVIVVLAAIPGCGRPASQSASDLDLYQAPSVTLWPNAVVPVCYDGTDGDNQALLKKARAILDTLGWSAVSKVSFTGWNKCGDKPSSSSGEVKLHFVSGNSQYENGYTSGFGAGFTLFNNVYLASDATDQHFQYEVLHEMGHAIGWDHEQQRPDNFPNGPRGPMKYCNDTSGGGEDDGGTYRTSYFDTQSLMSYCTGWPWQLSPGDVAGAQAAYGLKTPAVNGQNGSNNVASRAAGNLDTFFAHNDGSIWTTYWYQGMPSGNWPTFQLPGAAPGVAPKWAPIATVSRSADNLDIFYVNSSGGINTSFWTSEGGWGHLTVPGTAGLATPGEQVAAVAATPGAIDVFFAGKDKNLYWSRWSGQCGSSATPCNWTNPVKVVADGSIPAGSAVTAVARTPDRLDVFYVEADGYPHTSACYGFGTTGAGSCTSGGWTNFKVATVADCQATPGTPVAATARTGDNIDIFYASKKEAVCTNYWSSPAGWHSFAITAPSTLATWAAVTAVTRASGNLDLFYMTTNAQGTGELHTAFWAGAGWGTATIGGPDGGVGIPGGYVGAAARTSNNLDAFVPGVQLFSNQFTSMTTSYWDAGATKWATYQTNSYN